MTDKEKLKKLFLKTCKNVDFPEPSGEDAFNIIFNKTDLTKLNKEQIQKIINGFEDLETFSITHSMKETTQYMKDYCLSVIFSTIN